MNNKKFLQGSIKRHPDGFGFLIPDQKEHPDVYIPRQAMKGAMTNDKVMAEVEMESKDRYRGEIIRITKRGTTQLVGNYKKINDQYGIITDEGNGWGQDLRIPTENSMNAKTGEMVAAEILKYPDDGPHFLGRIKEIIGNVQEPMNDIRRVVLAQQIPEVFPQAVLDEAKKFGNNPTEEDFKNRVDLRSKNLITIDGATAKDFDDAVLVEKNSEGFLLYVAIADVSHYVGVGSAIDQEGYTRGTSVYFPNFVIPMLPEQLSNGLCSLNPHVPRLCVVAQIQFNPAGVVLGSKFYEAVMESKARVTYGKAQEVVDGAQLPELNHVRDNILLCAELAKILMAKRFEEGSLDLEIPETELEIDATGVPIDVIRSERLFAHRLIEEMMLAANVAVATFLDSKDIPAIYRIHEPPHQDALVTLEKYLWNFGGQTKFNQGKLQKKLTAALAEFEGKPEKQILHILTLRSMTQAKYSPNNVGHFGLGFEFYTHFTSPIRRYPDLIVHRLLKNQIMPNSKYRLMRDEDLATAGTYLSACEQRSSKAERQIQSIKKARFMEKFIGETFTALISSVAKFGVFALLREYDIDGLIRIEDLGQDHFEFDEENLRLVGKKTGFSYNIGDTVEIVVDRADTLEGKIDFILKSQEGKPRASDRKNDRKSNDRKSNDRNNNGDRKKNNDRSDRPDRRSNKSDRRQKNTSNQKSTNEKDSKNKFEKPAKSSRNLFAKLKKGRRKKEDENDKKTKPAGRVATNEHPEKRSSPEDHRGGLRKTRFSQRSGKSKAR